MRKIVIVYTSVLVVLLGVVIYFVFDHCKLINEISIIKSVMSKNENRSYDKNIDDYINEDVINNYLYVDLSTNKNIVNTPEKFMKIYYEYDETNFTQRLRDMKPLMTDGCYKILTDGMDLSQDIEFPNQFQQSVEDVITVVSDVEEENATVYAAAKLSNESKGDISNNSIIVEFQLKKNNDSWKIAKIIFIGSNEI